VPKSDVPNNKVLLDQTIWQDLSANSEINERV